MLTWQEAAATLTWISDVGVLVARISRQRYRTLKRRHFGEQEPAVGLLARFLVATSCWLKRSVLSISCWSRYTFAVDESVALFYPAAGLGDQLSTDMMMCAMPRCLLLSVLGFDPMSLWGLVVLLPVLFSGNPGVAAGRGFNPAGGAPGGGFPGFAAGRGFDPAGGAQEVFRVS
ncbi:hypothetical protein F511_32516 [Dorcoceras hygrometricum]|uniref:Uncharacterized protein n=1 Tax=Dorcoceras hygrometricum TaxID=472368 RepID=A0A2Z7C7K2_9LAMI|nr:hypothetical protein F511_32516 [Dorcoceras hygrometricum]